jgi:hypothetical protein
VIIDQIIKAIASLKSERKDLDDKIAALELAHETLGGGDMPAEMPKAKPSKRRRRDVDGLSKTLSLVNELGKPLTANRVARELRCTPVAARVRLLRLVDSKQVQRVSRGLYASVNYQNGHNS